MPPLRLNQKIERNSLTGESTIAFKVGWKHFGKIRVVQIITTLKIH
jgi:hypothetical protein